MRGHENRRFGGDRQGNGVAGTAVDFDQFAVLADADFGEVRVIDQVGDHDVLNLAAHLLEDRLLGLVHAYQQTTDWHQRHPAGGAAA